MTLKSLRYILWAAVAAAVIPLALLQFLPGAQDALSPPDIGQGDYRLTGTDGQPFTATTLTGQPSLVFFGFTHCPDVCPTTLGDMATWQAELGDSAAGLRIFMISVDPARDTAPVLADYIGWLGGAQGVTGPEPEVQKALRAFRAFAARVPLEGGDYTMDHSSSVLVFDAAGEFVTTIAYQAPLEEALAKLRPLLGG